MIHGHPAIIVGIVGGGSVGERPDVSGLQTVVRHEREAHDNPDRRGG